MSEETQATETPNTNQPAQDIASLPREARMAALKARVAKEDTETPAAPAEEATPQAAAEGAETPDAEATPHAETKDGEATSEAASDADDKDKEKSDAKPKEGADKLASKFAALARDKAKQVEREAAHNQAVRLHDERVKAHEAHVSKVTADLEKREAALNARAEEINAEILRNPEKLVRWLGAELGIDSIEKFGEYARGKWVKPEVPKPEQKPLTQADVDKLVAEKLEAAEKDLAAKADRARAEEDFDKGFADKDDAGALKYRAAYLVFDRAQRIRLGDDIANRLVSGGKTYASRQDLHNDVREAVNALAEREDRWQEIKKLGAPQVSGANGKQAATPAATPVADTNARQSRPGQTQLAAPPKKPEPPKPQANGHIDYRAARKARLANLAKD